LISAFRRSTTSRGVAAGREHAEPRDRLEARHAGLGDRRHVGKLGRARERRDAERAEPPARTCGRIGGRLPMNTCALPAITSVIAGVAPLYGTCVISMPSSA
jgi:hypothetical protein